MTAECSTYSKKKADHHYLWLDTTGSDDAPQVNELKEASKARCSLVSSRRFAIATNLVLFSLLASVLATQAEHFSHKRDASFRHEEGFPVSSTERLFFSIAVDHHPRHSSLAGTPNTFKDDAIIEILSARSSLSTAFATDKLDKSRVAGTDAKSHRNSSSCAATAPRLVTTSSFFQSAGRGTPSAALYSTYSTAAIRPTASNLMRESHVKRYSSPSKIPLSSTQAAAMQRENSTVITKVCHHTVCVCVTHCIM